MGRLAGQFNKIELAVESADRRLIAIVRGSKSPTVAFQDEESYYEYDTELDLASQLRATLDRVMNIKREAYSRAITERTNLSIDNRPHWDARIRRFREERDSLAIAGVSELGYVELGSIAMRQFEVRVLPDTFNDLEASDFLSEIDSAMTDLRDDWFHRMQTLKEYHLR